MVTPCGRHLQDQAGTRATAECRAELQGWVCQGPPATSCRQPAGLMAAALAAQCVATRIGCVVYVAAAMVPSGVLWPSAGSTALVEGLP
jgi:hypothetical protein